MLMRVARTIHVALSNKIRRQKVTSFPIVCTAELLRYFNKGGGGEGTSI